MLQVAIKIADRNARSCMFDSNAEKSILSLTERGVDLTLRLLLEEMNTDDMRRTKDGLPLLRIEKPSVEEDLWTGRQLGCFVVEALKLQKEQVNGTHYLVDDGAVVLLDRSTGTRP